MKKTILVLSILLLTACKNNEYKGSTGTDQGLKTSAKVHFDGTDYYKIFGKELPEKDSGYTTTTYKIDTNTKKNTGKDDTTSNKGTTVTSTTASNVKADTGTIKTSSETTYKVPDLKDTKGFLFPVENFSVKRDYKEGTYSGIDFSVTSNSKIYAVAPGMVIFAGNKASLGNALFIYHNNGYVSLYTNLEKLMYNKGDYINSTDDVIARASGSFGFEFRKRTDDGTVPLDPNQYLKKR